MTDTGTTHELTCINEKQDGDCGYACFFNGKQVGIYAASSYQAQQKAVEYFKPSKKRRFDVSVMLAERADGQTVSQSTAQF